MIKIKTVLIVIISLISFNSPSQVKPGAGVNLGRNNLGAEFQAYAFERAKGFVGMNKRKYNSFAMRIGVGVSIRPFSKNHNFWINSSIEHKFANAIEFTREEVYYEYFINDLNYWNIEGVYSFRIDKFFKEGSFLLVEAKLISKQLLNKVVVTPYESNSSVYLNDEKRLRRFYFSGALVNLGVKFVW